LWDVNEKGNEETAKLIKAIGAYVKSYKVDLSKREDIYNTAQKVCLVVGQQECVVLGLVKYCNSKWESSAIVLRYDVVVRL